MQGARGGTPITPDFYMFKGVAETFTQDRQSYNFRLANKKDKKNLTNYNVNQACSSLECFVCCTVKHG
jgi:hypothetical protein